MGLIDRIKSALFEEEEIEVPVKETKPEIEKTKSEDLRKIDIEETEMETFRSKEKKEKEEPLPVVKDDPIETKHEKTFEFPVFDEEEFKDSKSRTNRNVLEYEKRAKIEKRLDFNQSEVEPQVVKKFTPSPIISPVYGVIEGEFKKEDTLPKPARKEERKKSNIDVDMVRNKAFGTLEDEIENTLLDTNSDIYKQEPTKSIDELLTESSDGTIAVENVLDEIISNTESIQDIKSDDSLYEDVPERTIKPKPVNDFNLKDELESLLDEEDDNESLATYEVDRDTPVLEVLDEIDKPQSDKLDETLESDLFNLIDSMYETRKGE